MPLLLLFLFFSRHLLGCIGAVKRAVEESDAKFFLIHIKVFEGGGLCVWGSGGNYK